MYVPTPYPTKVTRHTAIVAANTANATNITTLSSRGKETSWSISGATSGQSLAVTVDRDRAGRYEGARSATPGPDELVMEVHWYDDDATLVDGDGDPATAEILFQKRIEGDANRTTNKIIVRAKSTATLAVVKGLFDDFDLEDELRFTAGTAGTGVITRPASATAAHVLPTRTAGEGYGPRVVIVEAFTNNINLIMATAQATGSTNLPYRVKTNEVRVFRVAENETMYGKSSANSTAAGWVHEYYFDSEGAIPDTLEFVPQGILIQDK